ncbi:MAG: hypothetical protein IKD99_00955 [Erysipelotrichaceae bacterium]|nr:hypothetical protein [Erysipelotrichaceae bacterium]
MKNKYVITRRENVRYVKERLDTLISNALHLSRYSEDDPLRSIAENNFHAAFDYIMNSPEIDNDYHCLLELHTILMDGLNEEIVATLTDEQIAELEAMLNQPAKANVEIAIDVMLYILDRRLFRDGDVRVAIMFANKFMIDHGCGIITVFRGKADTFRELYKAYRAEKTDDFKNWIYKYCIRGPKVEYQ